MTKIDIISDVQELEGLTAQWQQLALPSPMQSPAWLVPWWQAFQTSHDELHVVTVRDAAGELIGLAPWYRREGFASGATLRFLGDGRTCTDFQSILCRSGHETEVVSALIQWLTSDAHARWNLLDLEGISGADAIMQEFQTAMQARGHVTHVRQTLNTWRIAVHSDLSATLSAFPKTQMRQIRNFINRFEKGNFALRHASQEPEHTQFFIAELMRLHQLRWESIGQPGCFKSTEFRQFFQATMSAMIPAGQAEIVLLEREGKVVAANTWTLQNNIGFGYQCGRDPAEDEHKVGRILQAVALQDNCRTGLVAFDFLRGDEAYKQYMRAVPTPCQRLRVVARTRMSELRHSIWATCRDVRAMLVDYRTKS